VFERFTEGAREAVVLAQGEARTLGHDYIGTEHLLLGVLKQESVAARALRHLDVTYDDVRPEVSSIVGSGEEVGAGQIPFTPRSKKVLELALREALLLDHDHVGPEHILLGLVRENDGVAMQILRSHGADADRVRAAVMGELGIEPPEGYEELKSERRKSESSQGLNQYVPLIFGTVVVFGAALAFGIWIGWMIWGR
jgi:ATP-dependent Clp protease ATP-binding subunit ClpC